MGIPGEIILRKGYSRQGGSSFCGGQNERGKVEMVQTCKEELHKCSNEFSGEE